MALERMIYRFGVDEVGNFERAKVLLGGKGAGLMQMTSLGLPVPPGFTITTEVCAEFVRTQELPPSLLPQLTQAVDWIGDRMGQRFDAGDKPLLLSVRSGARASMPGMMDTILN